MKQHSDDFSGDETRWKESILLLGRACRWNERSLHISQFHGDEKGR